MGTLRTVTVKRAMYECERSQKTDVRRQKMGRRKKILEDKRDTQSPRNVCTFR